MKDCKIVVQVSERASNFFKYFNFKDDGSVEVSVFRPSTILAGDDRECLDLAGININTFDKGATYTLAGISDVYFNYQVTRSLTLDELVNVNEVNSFNYFPESQGFIQDNFNLYVQSFPTKGTDNDFLGRSSQTPAVLVNKPYKDCSKAETIIKIFVASSKLFATNLLAAKYTVVTEPYIFAKVSLSALADSPTIAPNSTINVTAQLIAVDGTPMNKAGITIEAKSNMGYLPYSKLVTDSTGKVKFKVNALGLDTSDTIKVKIGFEDFSNIVTVQLLVV